MDGRNRGRAVTGSPTATVRVLFLHGVAGAKSTGVEKYVGSAPATLTEKSDLAQERTGRLPGRTLPHNCRATAISSDIPEIEPPDLIAQGSAWLNITDIDAKET